MFPQSNAEHRAEEILQRARQEFEALSEKFDPYRVDVELIAALLFDLGVQQVPDLRVGLREYAGFLDVDARLIVIEANHHEHRKRFSVAHEVGHFVLHYNGKTGIQSDFPRCTSEDMETFSVPKDSARHEHQRREVEANQFASVLLMPEPSVKAMHKVVGGSVIKLSKHFGVSPLAMEVRLDRMSLPFKSIAR